MINTSLPRYLFFLFAMSILISWTAQDTDPWETKMDHQLIAKLQSGMEVEVLLILTQQADLSKSQQLKTKAAKGNFVFHQLKQAAKSSQTEILRFLRSQGASAQSFYVVNSIRTKGNLGLLQSLAEREDIAQIIENSAFRLEAPVIENGASIREVEWGIEMINADDVWAMGYTGQDVVVGGQDTGYDWEHPALKGKYRGWDGNTADHNYNWHDAIHSINPLHGDSIIDPSNNPCGLDSPFPCDDSSHGTHTMGTMVGSDGDNEVGVAPDAKWVACRNMERGWGSPASYIECFEWLMAPTDLNNENADPSKAPHVFANSWSCPEIEGCNASNWSVMETVVNNVKASGVVVVVSAGNSGGQGCGTVSTPAAMFENSFTIGSTRSNDRISGFSSRGPVIVDGSNRLKPNVSAPGSQVRSTTPGNNYATFSGTSMAGP
ncbi:MAG: S8 family serine peptidase, partial [Bacteroidota bacterium]